MIINSGHIYRIMGEQREAARLPPQVTLGLGIGLGLGASRLPPQMGP